MLFADMEVARAREHRPLSRGPRTAPSPTRVVLRPGPYRANAVRARHPLPMHQTVRPANGPHVVPCDENPSHIGGRLSSRR